MVRYTKDRIEKVTSDRLSGLTIQELMDKYDMPKTTVWHHVHKLKLNKDIQKKISSRRGGSSIRCKERWSIAKKESEDILKNFDLDNQWVSILVALYWSEGTKKRGFIFTNTDADMMKLYLKILHKYLNIGKDRLQVLVRLTQHQDIAVCQKYWSNVVGIHGKYIKIDINDKQNSSTNKYGICRVTIAKGGGYLKLIHSLIQGITERSLG